MAANRKSARKRKGKKRSSASQAGSIRVCRVPGKSKVFELVYPPSVGRRAEDMEEVRLMLDAGEIEVAVDELRWLLSGCHLLLEAHQLLGKIALNENDFELARIHFDYAYQLGRKAIGRRRLDGLLPQRRAANRAFFQAAFGLTRCLNLSGETAAADQVVKELTALDPAARPRDSDDPD